MFKHPLTYLLAANGLILLLTAASLNRSSDHRFSWLLFALLTLILIVYSYRNRRSKQPQQRIETSGDLVWKKFRRSRTALIGICILTIIIYATLLAPFIVPLDPLQMDWGAISQPPDRLHWLGTDDMGRDLFSRAIYGARIALGLGLMAVFFNTLLGTTLGILSGYFGGKTDLLIMRALELWSSLPFILFAIALMAALGSGLMNLVLVVSLTGIMEFARIIRSEALQLRKSDYVSAAVVLGLPHRLIILRHLLPNCLAPIIVMATLRIGDTILMIAGLSFLGLGINPPTPSLGSMLASGQQFLYENPAMSLVPGSMILLIVLAANLFGDGLRDALDSRLNE